MSDTEIIDLIRKRQQEAAVEKLYDHFPKIRSLVKQKGGSLDDARDIFQESLVIFYRKASDPGFILTSSISTYLYSVCWHLWKDALKKKSRNIPATEWPGIERAASEDVQEHILKEEKFSYLDKILLQVGDKCKEIFQLYYFGKQSMARIAEQLGLSSEQVAKNQKYKCLEKARELAKQMVSIH